MPFVVEDLLLSTLCGSVCAIYRLNYINTFSFCSSLSCRAESKLSSALKQEQIFKINMVVVSGFYCLVTACLLD